MPYPVKIIRRRRRKRSGEQLQLFGKWTIWLLTFMFVAILGLAFYAGLIYVQLIKDLPPVGNIEILFTETMNGFLEPIQVYSRSNEKLYDLLHPIAMERQWQHIGNIGDDVLPKTLLDAMVIAQDKTFLSNRGYDPGLLMSSIIQRGGTGKTSELPRSITQQLIKMTILPSDDFLRPDLWRYLREAILAKRLTECYSKNQILEWYINSFGFGNLTYGVDAAALVYFDKHATELTLAESALLAAISTMPSGNFFDLQEPLRERQAQILQAMLEQGSITTLQSREALLDDITFNGNSSTHNIALQRYTLDRLVDVLGTAIKDRAGLYVFTTINRELQIQVQCAAESLVSWSGGQDFDSTKILDGGVRCSNLEILQSLLSGDERKEFNIDELASVILDAKTGEVLSVYGSFEDLMPSTSMLYPFVYLAAFSRGSSPGTMVLDLPLDSMEEEQFDERISHGPIRMRTALVGRYPFAVQRTIQSVGLGNVLQVIGQMGIPVFQSEVDRSLAEGFPEGYRISLIDAVYSYGIFANSGKMVGTPRPPENEEDQSFLDSILIREVIDSAGRRLYQADRGEQFVVSQELSFLITDVLENPTPMISPFNRINLFELDRPSAVMNGMDQDGNLSWTIGYTPSSVVGVWLGNRSQKGTDDSVESLGSPALWHVFMSLVTQNQIVEDWQQPSGIVQVEICVPSGLLPTRYCPSMASEIFLNGMEPIHYDTFYQPFKINKETRKLATLYTPLDLIVEQVFFVPPAEAMEWAREAGYLQPPDEYDTLKVSSLDEDSVQIDNPQNFDYVQGRKWISGRTKVNGFRYYRLQYGEGLNPTYWFQIGENQYTPVSEGTLLLWDTTQLDGLYALQLIVVDQDGIAYVDTKYVTVDNEKPEVVLFCPDSTMRVELEKEQSITCNVQVSDNIGISKVEFYVGEQRINIDFTAPFSLQLEADALQEGTLSASAYDLAGNVSQSDGILISIVE
jgi:membrane peptidoglycan carboxypeptidase